jgi:branched-subunit amino acid transport protein
MDQREIFLVIVGMTLVTYLPRLLPALVLSSRRLPDEVGVWLRYVPPAVLAAMLAPALLLRDRHLVLGHGNLFLWASVPTLVVARLSKSLFLTVLTGMAVVAVARYLGA